MEEEGGKKKKVKGKHYLFLILVELEKEEEDYEEFLDEVGKNKEMRKNINLYRNEDGISKLTEKELKLKEKQRAQNGRKII
jgi:nonsense-mediated mRNA decay protein 3